MSKFVSRQKRRDREAEEAEIAVLAPKPKQAEVQALPPGLAEAMRARQQLMQELQAQSSSPIMVNVGISDKNEYELYVRALECRIRSYAGYAVEHIPVTFSAGSRASQ